MQGKLRLSKPTAHRLLMSLVSHGFVEQDDTSKRYRLGSRLAVLAWSVPQRRPDLGRIAAPSAQRLAERSGDTVFVMARDGLDNVCVGRETGSFPIKALTIDVGTRRPLGVGAGGIAVLASMPPDEARRSLDSTGAKLKAYPLTSVEVIQRGVDQARRLGYSVSDGQVATRRARHRGGDPRCARRAGRLDRHRGHPQPHDAGPCQGTRPEPARRACGDRAAAGGVTMDHASGRAGHPFPGRARMQRS